MRTSQPTTIDEAIFTMCTTLWRRSSLLDATAVALAQWTPMVMLFLITAAGFGFGWTVSPHISIALALTAVVAAVSARVVNEPLSRSFARPRPFDTCMVNALMRHESGESFPSNHATGAFALACPFIGFEPYAGVLFTLAVLLCLSRLYTGLHYFTDIVAGAINGTVMALVVVFAVRMLFGQPL